ncbi:MAG: hypothetical protein ACREMY_01765, partial [bacterium]
IERSGTPPSRRLARRRLAADRVATISTSARTASPRSDAAEPTPSGARTMADMDARDIRTWAANHRAAAAREMAEARRHPLTAAQAFASALALLALDEEQNGSPFERYDPVTEREDQQMWNAWTKLRARWRSGR